MNSCSYIQVQTLFAVMSKVYKFFDNHPKRQYLLNRFCEGSEMKLSSYVKLDGYSVLMLSTFL